MDAYSVRSHQRTSVAQDSGFFTSETAPLVDETGIAYTHDDGLRRDSSLPHLARLKPFFDKKYGRVTAGNSSQVTDGATWLILASEEAVSRYGLTPIGQISDSQWAGLAPEQMGPRAGPRYNAHLATTRDEPARRRHMGNQ